MENLNHEKSNQAVQKKSKTIAIIGGGIGGLYTAWKLCKKGFKITLLEQQKFLGGLSTSIQHEGFKIDIGPHYVTFPKESELVDDIKELMGNENILEISDIHKSYRTCFRGRISHTYPTLYETILTNGMIFWVHSFYDLIISKCKNFFRNKEFKSGRDYLISTYGNFLYKTWFKPYLIFTFGETEGALDIIEKRFPPISLQKIFSSLKQHSQKSEVSKPKNENDESNQYFHWYPKFGMGSVIDALQEKISNKNGTIINEANVSTIEHDRFPKIIHYSKNKQQFEISAEAIVYATPLYVTKKWFPNRQSDIKPEFKKNTALHGIIVFLFINSPRVFDGWVITVYDTHLPFFRVAQQNFLSDYIAPSEKSLLSLEIKSGENDQIWKLDEPSLISHLEQNLTKSGILHGEKIEGYKVIKIKNLYPPATQTKHDDNYVKIVDSLNEFKNEYLLGSADVDVGRLASNVESTDNSKTSLSLGGVHAALSNANILVNRIISENS